MLQMFRFRDCVFKPNWKSLSKTKTSIEFVRSYADLELVTCKRLIDQFQANLNVYPKRKFSKRLKYKMQQL